jgi:outer membrane protein assembly factor BamB
MTDEPGRATIGNSRGGKTNFALNRRFAGVGGLIFALLLAAPWLPHAVAGAPTLRLVPASGPPGIRPTAAASGFQPGETVQIAFDAAVVAEKTADSSGSLRARFRVPADAAPGPHPVTASGESSGLVAQASFQVRTNWTQFGFTARHTGHNVFENVLDPSNVDQLALDWDYVTGGQILSSPAVVNGIVYIGSIDGYLYALDAHTGALRWHALTGGDVISSPAVWRGRVFVAATDGVLYAYDAADGDPLWQATVDAPLYFSSPALSDGVLYIASSVGSVYAFEPRTGALLWKGSAGLGEASSPAVANDLVYVGSAQGDVYAFPTSCSDPCTPAWVADAGTYGSSPPSVAGGMVYVGTYTTGGDIVALNATTGSEGWRVPVGGPVISSPAVANGVVYVGSEDGNLFALDAESGAERWTSEVGSIESAPAVANGVVYVGAYSALFAWPTVCSESCPPLWSLPYGTPRFSSPAVVDGRVYFGSDTGIVYAYGLS